MKFQKSKTMAGIRKFLDLLRMRLDQFMYRVSQPGLQVFESLQIRQFCRIELKFWDIYVSDTDLEAVKFRIDR